MTARTVLVTGAATGIGLATSRELAAHGWTVLGTALPGQDAADLRAIDGVTVLDADLADDASRDALIRDVIGRERLDAIVSNAGMVVPGPIEGIGPEQLRRQFEVNTIAPMALAKAFLPRLRESSGRMVFVGAGQGRVALPFGGPYAASKSALAMLTDALRAEVADSGVHVSLLELGAVRTDILTTSRASSTALLEQLPADIAQRYEDAVTKTFARADDAFERAMPADEVARLIGRILDAPSPKPRYLVGREARALGFVALLPARWRARLVSRLAR